MSDYWGVALMGCWTIGLSDYWCIGLMERRNNSIAQSFRQSITTKDHYSEIPLFRHLIFPTMPLLAKGYDPFPSLSVEEGSGS